jgi:hypothetical protein
MVVQAPANASLNFTVSVVDLSALAYLCVGVDRARQAAGLVGLVPPAVSMESSRLVFLFFFFM